MQIEILVEGSQPALYPFIKQEILIGSSDECDIVVPLSNISKKHLQLISVDNTIYAVDFGSTNGSFLNDERLTPGKRIEFTSFFPIRLGTKVLITLVSDDTQDMAQMAKLHEPMTKGSYSQDKTSVISLKDLKDKNATLKLSEARERMNSKRVNNAKVPTINQLKKNQNQILGTWFMLVLVVGLGFYKLYQRKVASTQKLVASSENLEVKQKKLDLDNVEKPSENDLQKSLLTKKLQDNLQNFKCSTDLEKEICSVVFLNAQTLEGVIEDADRITFYFSDKDLILQTMSLMEINQDQLEFINFTNNEWAKLSILGSIYKMHAIKDFKLLKTSIFVLYSSEKVQVTQYVELSIEKLEAIKKMGSLEILLGIKDKGILSVQNLLTLIELKSL